MASGIRVSLLRLLEVTLGQNRPMTVLGEHKSDLLFTHSLKSCEKHSLVTSKDLIHVVNHIVITTQSCLMQNIASDQQCNVKQTKLKEVKKNPQNKRSQGPKTKNHPSSSQETRSNWSRYAYTLIPLCSPLDEEMILKRTSEREKGNVCKALRSLSRTSTQF